MRDMRSRCLVTMAVLVAWIMVGPIATAFCTCCGTGTPCERSCPLTSNVGPAPSDPASSLLMAYAPFQRSDRSPQPVLQVPDPPPRPLVLAA